MATKGKKRNTKKRKKRRVTALCITSLAVLGGYIGGISYFRTHFFPGTTIGEISCGNQTSDYVESRNIKSAEDYLLTIFDRNGNKYHIAGMDFNYTYQSSGEEKALLHRQSVLSWPTAVFSHHHYDI